MLSSCGEDGSEEASSSFVYLLDSSSASNSTRQQQQQQQQQQLQQPQQTHQSYQQSLQQSQLLNQQHMQQDRQTTHSESTRRSRFAPLPQRGQPFWLTDIGSDYTEQTEMRYQIPCPADFTASSGANNSKSSSSNNRQSALWRCRLGKMEHSEKVGLGEMA